MPQIFSAPAAFSPQDCAAITAMAAGAGLKQAGLVRGASSPDLRRAEIAWLDDMPGAAWVMDRLTGLMAEANRQTYGYDLTDFAESAQCACYRAETAGHFAWHSDIGAGALAAKRKLTLVVQLSDPASYDGGGLEIWPDSHVHHADRAQGTATVFPSFMLHRVTPVTAGLRWSLTLWAHGPAFR